MFTALAVCSAALAALSSLSEKSTDTACVLIDNGSLRAASTLNLRYAAQQVEEVLRLRGVHNIPVVAASIRFSDRVPAEELHGEKGLVLPAALRMLVRERKIKTLIVLPMFLGPSEQVSKTIPEMIESFLAKEGDNAPPQPHTPQQLRVLYADPLVRIGEGGEDRVVRALAERVQEQLDRAGRASAKVILVDHGTPTRAVSEVRDYLGDELRKHLGSRAEELVVASMERREGDEYAFNDPLLPVVFDTMPAFRTGLIIISMAFLSPGRHAGDGGDIATMLSEAQAKYGSGTREEGSEAFQPVMTGLLGNHRLVIELLADRVLQVFEKK